MRHAQRLVSPGSTRFFLLGALFYRCESKNFFPLSPFPTFFPPQNLKRCSILHEKWFSAALVVSGIWHSESAGGHQGTVCTTFGFNLQALGNYRRFQNRSDLVKVCIRKINLAAREKGTKQVKRVRSGSTAVIYEYRGQQWHQGREDEWKRNSEIKKKEMIIQDCMTE